MNFLYAPLVLTSLILAPIQSQLQAFQTEARCPKPEPLSLATSAELCRNALERELHLYRTLSRSELCPQDLSDVELIRELTSKSTELVESLDHAYAQADLTHWISEWAPTSAQLQELRSHSNQVQYLSGFCSESFPELIALRDPANRFLSRSLPVLMILTDPNLNPR